MIVLTLIFYLLFWERSTPDRSLFFCFLHFQGTISSSSFPLFWFLAISGHDRRLIVPSLLVFYDFRARSAPHRSLSFCFLQFQGTIDASSFPLFSFLAISGHDRRLIVPSLFVFGNFRARSAPHRSLSFCFLHFQGTISSSSFPLFLFLAISGHDRRLIVPSLFVFGNFRARSAPHRSLSFCFLQFQGTIDASSFPLFSFLAFSGHDRRLIVPSLFVFGIFRARLAPHRSLSFCFLHFPGDDALFTFYFILVTPH